MSDNRLSEKEKEFIHDRAYGCCEYCQSQDKWATQRFVVEHIIPKSKNGLTELSNLALACPGCNNHKYNITEGIDSLNQTIAPLFNPRTQIWTEHVDIIKLNRQRLINRREAFLLLGLHPPLHTLT